MEGFGSFLDEEWESLSKIFSPEDSDFLLQFNGENLFPNQVDDQSLLFPSDAFDQTNFYCISQESSNSSDIEGPLFTNPVHENGASFLHNLTTNTDFSVGLMMPVFPHDHVMEENAEIQQPAETGDFLALKRKYETSEIQMSLYQSPKKKPRVSGHNGQKNKRNTQSKKNKEAVIQNDCSSEEEDDSNASESNNLASNGKAKTNRGSATDPQSLYARRRRERINERLRILQNLVPNGTKVDISTMLEEALHYVKFLQLQIKLLSSDELWMYAPIAYNGMDIGLYQKINIPNLRC